MTLCALFCAGSAWAGCPNLDSNKAFDPILQRLNQQTDEDLTTIYFCRRDGLATARRVFTEDDLIAKTDQVIALTGGTATTDISAASVDLSSTANFRDVRFKSDGLEYVIRIANSEFPDAFHFFTRKIHSKNPNDPICDTTGLPYLVEYIKNHPSMFKMNIDGMETSAVAATNGADGIFATANGALNGMAFRVDFKISNENKTGQMFTRPRSNFDGYFYCWAQVSIKATISELNERTLKPGNYHIKVYVQPQTP